MIKAIFLVLGGIVLAIFFMIAIPDLMRFHEEHPEQSEIPREPEIQTKTLALLPGQSYDLQNRRFRKIEVRSEYPLRVFAGSCHDAYTVQFFCESEPSDLFITDTRSRPIFFTPRSNSVTITATEF